MRKAQTDLALLAEAFKNLQVSSFAPTELVVPSSEDIGLASAVDNCRPIESCKNFDRVVDGERSGSADGLVEG